MRKMFLKLFIFTFFILMLNTCNDPIFYMVSKEIKQLKPLIGGSPTNFVDLNGTMFVASGKKIYSYKSGFWGIHPQNRWIAQLAATTTQLYVLYDNGSVTRPFSSNPGISARSIFAVGDVLFYSNGNTIYYLDDSDNSTGPIATSTSMLNGAASDGTDYYLCTNNSGIYLVSGSLDTSTLIDGSQKEFTGIISLKDDTIVAITRGGVLYKIDENGISEIASFGGRMSSGALALFSKEVGSDPTLLLAGRQDNLTYSINSGYTYGYLELMLDASSGGISPGSIFSEPGMLPITTVSTNEQYTSSIGKNPVNHIFQADDGILFASTQLNGVWSYRMRDGLFQWNTETGN